MNDRFRHAVAPAYLLLCIIFGGSRQGPWFNFLLEIVGLAIIVWSVLSARHVTLSPAAKQLFLLAAAVVLVALIQLVPLPPDLWTAFGGRDPIADGYRLLGLPEPWLPMSLVPNQTAATIPSLIPPAAVLSAMLVADAYRPRWIAIAILVGTFAAILLGAMQVGTTSTARSSWYLYEYTNSGSATGFFANSNHMGSLLMISVPLVAALLRDLKPAPQASKHKTGILMAAGAAGVVLLAGMALNGSLAVLLLAPPVLAGSAAMVVSRRRGHRRLLVAAALVAVAGSAAVYQSSSADIVGTGSRVSIERRQSFWSTTLAAAVDQLPTGSGLGSFERIYPMYDAPDAVTRTIVNHAHNDYLEVALELGIAGALLLVLFLLWWLARTWHVWRTPAPVAYAQAATIASAALLMHSLVDFPLRTAALSAIMAAMLALMAQPRTRSEQEVPDLWPTRHLTV
jgi:O-antigen ligase